jgi:hypothetical protein
MKSIYALQPYKVGSTKAKSLALIIPAKVARKFGIDTSTVFALQTNTSTNTITLQQTSHPIVKQEIPAGEGLTAINQQVGRNQ